MVATTLQCVGNTPVRHLRHRVTDTLTHKAVWNKGLQHLCMLCALQMLQGPLHALPPVLHFKLVLKLAFNLPSLVICSVGGQGCTCSTQ